MRFLDPFFLLGLGALAVPIALHLLFRRRVQVQPFPLVRLIEAAERTRQPRRRLNRVLLLLARAAMLALLALALARLLVGAAPTVAADGPVALVVVVDDSLSQRADVGGRSSWEAGLDEVDELLARLPAGSEVALVLGSAPEQGVLESLGPDVGRVRRQLAALEPTWSHVRIGPALEAARRALAESALEERRVVLMSDLARHSFEGLAAVTEEPPAPALLVVAPARESSANRSVSGLDLAVLPDGRLRATARVSAWGAPAQDLGLRLFAGRAGESPRLAGRAEVSPDGGASAERRFDLAAPQPDPSAGRVGATWAIVEVRLEGDVLVADDVRAAVTPIVRPPSVLVVDGDPQNLSFGSETFYLERALAPGVGLDLDAHFVTPGELEPQDFAQHDVVVLANVAELNAERAEALVSAVRSGTGLVVSVGDRLDVPTWNGRLASVVPATLGVPADVPGGGGVTASVSALSLPRVIVRRVQRVEPDPAARVLARTDNGWPLVVEQEGGELGAGRSLLVTTTLDREWTDLPISPHFLPFLRALIARASARVDVGSLETVVVDQAVDLADVAEGPLRVVGPDGRAEPVPEDGVFRGTRRPGVHRVVHEDRTVAAFAVVTDPRESDLTRQSASDLESALAGRFTLASATIGEGAAGGRPAWPWLLVGLVALAGVEAHLARRAS